MWKSSSVRRSSWHYEPGQWFMMVHEKCLEALVLWSKGLHCRASAWGTGLRARGHCWSDTLQRPVVPRQTFGHGGENNAFPDGSVASSQPRSLVGSLLVFFFLDFMPPPVLRVAFVLPNCCR